MATNEYGIEVLRDPFFKPRMQWRIKSLRNC
jgi:hypothetical protein